MPKPPKLEWKVAWYAAGRVAPARAYLNKLDPDRRHQLLGWVEAIRRYPPGPICLPAGRVLIALGVVPLMGYRVPARNGRPAREELIAV